MNKKIVVLEDLSEIPEYRMEFVRRIDYLIQQEPVASEFIFSDGIRLPIKKSIEDEDVFIVVSDIYNKNRQFRWLESLGMIRNINFVWGPEWQGNDEIPSCYTLKSWDDNKAKYDFSGDNGPWDYRYEVLLSSMDSSTKSVIDCGAGNMSLQRLLSTNIMYYPVDKNKEYERTIVCDFDKGEFPAISADCAFLCGILEYLSPHNVELLASRLSKSVNQVLLSYNTLNAISSIKNRLLNGWRNHYTTGEIVAIFQKNGMHITEEIYTDAVETYLVFKRA